MKEKERVEIWGDIVEIRSLVLAIFISSTSTMAAYFLAGQANRTRQLFFGLGGALLGFLLSTLLIKPKRIIIKEGEEK